MTIIRYYRQMSKFVSITEVKRNPAVLTNASAKGGISIVMRNNKPAFVAVPYFDGIEEAIEDLLPLKASLITTLEKAKSDVASGRFMTHEEMRRTFGI